MYVNYETYAARLHRRHRARVLTSVFVITHIISREDPVFHELYVPRINICVCYHIGLQQINVMILVSLHICTEDPVFHELYVPRINICVC